MKTLTNTASGCTVVEQIVAWEQVQAGDLVLYRGEFQTVAEVIEDTSQPAYVALRFDGSKRVVWVRRDHFTAVTRYVEAVHTDQDREEAK